MTARPASCLACVALVSCGGLVPRAGPPWIEDPLLELAREELSLFVEEGLVRVDALFVFVSHGPQRDRVMFFPVPGPGAVPVDFGACLESGDGDEVPLVIHAGATSWLPAGETVQGYDMLVPADGLGGPGRALRVGYVQAVECGFAYTLASGAYWRGPIGALDVTVVDDGGLVLRAEVEGDPPHATQGRRLVWRFERLEPRGGVGIELRCP